MKKTELVLATRNKHKVFEISHILKGLKVRIIPIDDIKRAPEVEEDGDTLKYNASKKARTIALFSGKWALADDTGLEVGYLGGEPGVYSARWAGPGCSYADNNKKLLRKLKGVTGAGRKAAFKCVIALSSPAGKVLTVEGKIAGSIAESEKGAKGFGYDPLFIVPALKRTFAELPIGIKNKISHRARALKKARKLILKQIKN
jgi:XTP/dITP diphosphohydrolase